MEEKRKAGDYDIIESLMIGNKEIVIGENQNGEEGQKYMTAYCKWNDIFALYSDVLVSDDYTQIIGCFGKRVAEQAEKTRQELIKPETQGIQPEPITVCDAITSDNDLNDKVIVIRPEILRREYRTITNQVMYCTGGFGASPNSRGSAVFCKNLYNGKDGRFECSDVLGTIEPDALPKWARIGLADIRKEKETEYER